MIEDVIKNVRESFLNEGVDEQVLQELKQVRVFTMKQERRNCPPLLGLAFIREKYKWQLWKHLGQVAHVWCKIPAELIEILKITACF